MLPTDLTVAALVQEDDRFLIVEERASGVMVVTQPGGHIEAGESPEDAVIRETLEESGCSVDIGSLLGVYLWIDPQTGQQFLKIVYVARFLAENASNALDADIHAVHWYSLDDLRRRRNSVKSPVVIRCVEDFLSGQRRPGNLLAGLVPIQHNVDRVLARAALV